jgi:hypothetical protein
MWRANLSNQSHPKILFDIRLVIKEIYYHHFAFKNGWLDLKKIQPEKENQNDNKSLYSKLEHSNFGMGASVLHHKTLISVVFYHQ